MNIKYSNDKNKIKTNKRNETVAENDNADCTLGKTHPTITLMSYYFFKLRLNEPSLSTDLFLAVYYIQVVIHPTFINHALLKIEITFGIYSLINFI